MPWSLLRFVVSAGNVQWHKEQCLSAIARSCYIPRIIAFRSRDCEFNYIPGAHENRARVARPSFPRAGDAIHPALWK